MSAREIAARLRSDGVEAGDRTAVNRALFRDLRDQVTKAPEHQWVVSDGGANNVAAPQSSQPGILSPPQGGERQAPLSTATEFAGAEGEAAGLPPAQAQDLRRLQMLVRTSVEWQEDPSDTTSGREAWDGWDVDDSARVWLDRWTQEWRYDDPWEVWVERGLFYRGQSATSILRVVSSSGSDEAMAIVLEHRPARFLPAARNGFHAG